MSVPTMVKIAFAHAVTNLFLISAVFDEHILAVMRTNHNNTV